MPEQKIGIVVHYWSKPGAAQIELEHGVVQVGDRIRVKGHGRDFEQDVLSLEIDHRSKSEGYPGEHIAVAMDQPVRAMDEVYLVRRTKLDLFR